MCLNHWKDWRSKIRKAVKCSVQLLQKFMFSTTRTSAITTVKEGKVIPSFLLSRLHMRIFIGRTYTALQNLVLKSLRNLVSGFQLLGYRDKHRRRW